MPDCLVDCRLWLHLLRWVRLAEEQRYGEQEARLLLQPCFVMPIRQLGKYVRKNVVYMSSEFIEVRALNTNLGIINMKMMF